MRWWMWALQSVPRRRWCAACIHTVTLVTVYTAPGMLDAMGSRHRIAAQRVYDQTGETIDAVATREQP